MACKTGRFCARRKYFTLMGAVIVVGFIAGAFAASQGSLGKLSGNTMVIIELSLAALTGALAGLAACWLSTPDVRQQKWVIWLPILPLTCLSFLISYEFLIIPFQFEAGVITMKCMGSIASLAILPAVCLAILLRQHRTTHNNWFTAMSVTAVGCFVYFCSRLICPKDDMEYLLVWHYIPTLAITIISAIIVRRAVKW